MKYEKYKIPPNFDLAQIHANSCKLYKQVNNESGSKCGCCNQFVGENPVSICQNISSLRRIGEEVPLFFYFIILLILLIIIVYFAKAGQYLFLCNESCDDRLKFHFEGLWGLNFDIILGYINKENNLSMMIEMIIYSFIIILIKIHLKKKKYRYRAFNLTIEKRSVELINLPKDCTEKQVRKLFKDYNVEQVIFTYRVRQYHKCMVKIAMLKKNLRYLNSKIEQSQIEAEQTQKIEQKLASSMKKLQYIIKDLNNKKKRLSIAFLVFETVSERNQALKKFSCNLFLKLFYKMFASCSNCAIRKQHVTVQPATAPDDVKWQNLENPYLRTKAIRFSSFLICTAILTFGLVSQVIIFNFQGDSKDSSTTNQIFSSMVIFLVNFFIVNFLEYVTNKTESHISNTNIKLSVIRKVTFFMFVNVSISPFFIMLYNRITTQEKHSKLYERIILTVFILSIGNLFKPLLSFLSIARFKKWLQCTKQKSKGVKSQLNQIEANQLFQPLEFPIEVFYSFLHASLMMTFFYLSCFQILAVVELPSLLMLYIVAKWMLLKVCKQPRGLSAKLSNLAQSLMRFYVPLYWLGRNSMYLITYDGELDFFVILKDMVYKDPYQIVSVCIVVFMLFCEVLVAFIAKKLTFINKQKNSQYLQQLVDHNRTYQQSNLFFKIHEQDFARVTVRTTRKPKNNKNEEDSQETIELQAGKLY